MADAERGARLFTQHCATCHRVKGEGQAVGPDLSGVASRPVEALVEALMDPSREVSPDFRNFVAADTSGRIVTGLLVSETPAGVTLCGAGGVDALVPRAQLESLQVTDKSLMPEGLETQLDPGQVGDVIAYLREVGRGGSVVGPGGEPGAR
jgi:putative heme-binding domain-containing protein